MLKLSVLYCPVDKFVLSMSKANLFSGVFDKWTFHKTIMDDAVPDQCGPFSLCQSIHLTRGAPITVCNLPGGSFRSHQLIFRASNPFITRFSLIKKDLKLCFVLFRYIGVNFPN